MERRLKFALDRHESRLSEVSGAVSDLNGPRGGSDKRCHIQVRLQDGTSLSIEVRGEDGFAVVNAALRRLTYRLGRRVDRIHKPVKAHARESVARKLAS